MKTKNRRSLLLLFAVACCAVLPSCGGVAETYVHADRATYDAVAPDFLRYVEADPALDAEQKARRVRTVDTWRTRLETAEGASR